MAIEHTSKEGSESATGNQELPPFVLFQTPPPGAAKYRTESLRGSEASLTTRGGAPPAGPTKFQAVWASRASGKMNTSQAQSHIHVENARSQTASTEARL